MKLKRMGLWAIGTGVLIGVGLVTAERGYADDTTKCTLAMLKGQYLFTDQGTVVASAGYHIFNPYRPQDGLRNIDRQWR